MASQDAALAQISEGVGRLHNHAKAIGEEATLQNKMLDTLDEKVDSAHGVYNTFNLIRVIKRIPLCFRWTYYPDESRRKH